MRGLRSTLALVVVLGGLGAYIYFVTWKQPAERRRDRSRKVFAGLEADKIDELRVKSESGDTTVAQEGQGRLAPRRAGRRRRRRNPKRRGITSALVAARDRARRRREAGEPQRLRPRRAADRGRVQGGGRQGLPDAPHRPEDRRPAATCSRKRSAEKRVFLIARVPGADVQPSRRSICATRRCFKFDRDKVDRIEVDADGKTLELAKTGSDWKLVEAGAGARRTSRPSKASSASVHVGADEVDRVRQRQRPPISRSTASTSRRRP